VLGWALLLAASAAVAFRRRHPLGVLAVTSAATAAWLAARHPYGPVFLPLCVATYTAAASLPRERFPALAAGVAGLLAVLVAIGVADGRERLYDQVPNQLPRVLLAYQPGQVLVEVSDDGPGSTAAAGPGSGIAGMRERVAAAGGDQAAGPSPGGGFQVRARLPLDDP
jgi:hypothetical protein